MINVFKSRTNWTVVIMIVTSIAQAMETVMAPELYTLLVSVLGALTIYFRTVPAQHAE